MIAKVAKRIDGKWYVCTRKNKNSSLLYLGKHGDFVRSTHLKCRPFKSKREMLSVLAKNYKYYKVSSGKLLNWNISRNNCMFCIKIIKK